MAESKTKSKAAKTLADDSKSKTAKKVAAKTLAADKPNQALAEAAVQEAASGIRSIDIPHIADGVTEYVAEGAEVVAGGFENVAEVSRGLSGRDISLVLAGVVVGAAIGGYVGFRIAEKKMRLRFDELLEEETQQAKEHYRMKLAAREGENLKPELADMAAFRQAEQEVHVDLVEELGYVAPTESATLSGKTPAQIMKDAPETERMRSVREEGARLVSEIEADAGPREGRSAERQQFITETRNLFEARNHIPEWDYAAESKLRDPRLPYVIHEDEFRENPQEHEQVSLTFYEGDEVLTEDSDEVVHDVDERVGFDNLNRFGHGSPSDPHAVHIRNEVSEVDYEIVRSMGYYIKDVLGMEPENDGLQHSDQSWRGKQSFDDD